MQELTIRQAKPGDAEIIAEFNALMAEETEGRALEQATLLRGVKAVLADAAKGVYYLAEVGGTVVGQLMITFEWSDWRSGNFWWIQSVYVRREYRSKGVFRALYRHIEQLARGKEGVCGLRLYVDKHNERAKATYRSLGMKETSYEMYEIDFVLKS